MSEFDRILSAKYVLLTTYRKDGSSVGTPLWAAADGNQLLMWTVTDSYKVKRLKRNPAATVAVCTARGVPQGPAVDVQVEVLDESGSNRARSAITRKYGVVGWFAVTGSKLRRGNNGTVGLVATVPSSHPS